MLWYKQVHGLQPGLVRPLISLYHVSAGRSDNIQHVALSYIGRNAEGDEIEIRFLFVEGGCRLVAIGYERKTPLGLDHSNNTVFAAHQKTFEKGQQCPGKYFQITKV